MRNSSAEGLLDMLERRQRPVQLWWRDDDAGQWCEQLEQIVSISAETDVPLAVAAVPDWLDDKAARLLARHETVTVLQHGSRHANHGASTSKKIELGGAIATADMLADLGAGRSQLASLCGEGFLPVLVPPWNRIEDRILAGLTGLGFIGVSTHRGDFRGKGHGLGHVNTHVDAIDWAGGRGFIGNDQLADQLAEAIVTWPGEPIGLLTHHAAMDQAALAEVGKLIARLRPHPNVDWCGARALFGEGAFDDTAAIDP